MAGRGPKPRTPKINYHRKFHYLQTFAEIQSILLRNFHCNYDYFWNEYFFKRADLLDLSKNFFPPYFVKYITYLNFCLKTDLPRSG